MLIGTQPLPLFCRKALSYHAFWRTDVVSHLKTSMIWTIWRKSLPTSSSQSSASVCASACAESSIADDLAKVSSYFVESIKRKRLRERLRGIFDRPYALCKIHNY